MNEAQQELEVQENDKSVLKQAMKELETEKNGLAMDLGILVKVGTADKVKGSLSVCLY